MTANDFDAPPGPLRAGSEPAAPPAAGAVVKTAQADDRDIDTQLDALFDGRGPVPPELRELVGLDTGALLWRDVGGRDPVEPDPREVVTIADIEEPLDDVVEHCGDLGLQDPGTVDAESPGPEAVPPRPRRQLPSWIPGLAVGVLVGVAVMAALFPVDEDRDEVAGERRSAVAVPHSWERANAEDAEAPLPSGMRRAQVAAEPVQGSAGEIENAGIGRVAYQAPLAVLRVLPEYAPADLPVGESQRVVLRVLVDEKGHAARVLVESGSAGSPLVAAAVDAVVQSHYRPATENGLSVAAWTTESFVFER